MTRGLLTIAAIVSITYAIRTFVPLGSEVLSPGVTLAAGFLLITAIQTGHVFERLRLPHLTGFIIAGLVFGPEVLDLISRRALESLAVIKGVSVGLIALLAGCELNFTRLRPRLRAIGTYMLASTIVTVIVLFGFFYVVTGMLDVSASMTAVQRATIALVCATVLCAFSPPVVIALIGEARAAGPMSDLWIAIAVVADLAIVISFSITNSIARAVFPTGESSGEFVNLLIHIFASMAAGIVVALLLAWYVRAVGSRVGLFVFMLLFVVAEAGTSVHLNPLIAGLAAGFFLENISPVGGARITEETAPVAMPVYAIFFAVIGAEVHLQAFFGVALMAIVAALLRAAGLFTGSRLAARLLRAPAQEASLAPFGMLPQAGIALALAALVSGSFRPWGPVVGTLLLGSIVVNEMIGPVLLRFAIVRSGEAKGER